ncbi:MULTISPECIES: hypothetical protein [Chryseobacterium]|uniref:hypothetical protein n=1 Tax=Chryseobacterium TaxID=59732 RepID=UPI001296F821|nr:MULTISPECIES: hypothetical protein [Chryseobacterium]MDR6921974.1 hypothetical protein [Chryseobacterium sp. 2987]
MKQFINFILIIIISTLSAGVYGIVHDQITYTISSEYYTLLKFQQFGFENLNLNVRIKVGIIGFLATWWVGLFLGIVYAFISLFLDAEKVLKVTIKSILINICITFISGILGYGFSVLFLSPENTDWYIPTGTKNIRSFINVGSIHNFGYIGGIIGLAAGLLYQIKKARNI